MIIFAQILGLVATLFCILNPLFKKKWQMLVVTAGINIFFGINVLILTNYVVGSAFLMNCVAVLQCVISYFHTVKEKKVTIAEHAAFSVLYIGCGIWGLLNATNYAPAFNYQTMLELLPIIGAVLNMLAVFVRDEQTTRKFTLGNASVYTVYMTLIRSTNVFAELAAVITTSIALYKYRKKAEDQNAEKEEQTLQG